MDNPARIREHLANEPTFLAWVRTGVAVVIFGFAIGRFAIAIQEFMRAEGHPDGGSVVQKYAYFRFYAELNDFPVP